MTLRDLRLEWNQEMYRSSMVKKMLLMAGLLAGSVLACAGAIQENVDLKTPVPDSHSVLSATQTTARQSFVR